MKHSQYKRLLAVVTSLAILLTAMLSANIFVVYAEEGSEAAKAEIPYTTSDDYQSSYSSSYDYKTFDVYSADEAAAADVPAGYSGYVIKLTGDAEMGIGLDFTSQQIKLEDIHSLTMRVWVGENTREVRLANNKDFIVQNAPTAKQEWIDITVKADGTGFKGSYSFLSFENNSDGTLGTIHFCIRSNGSTGLAYVDSITLLLNDDVVEEEGGKDYFENPIGRDEIPYVRPIPSIPFSKSYKYSDMAVYTAEEAVEAGVPQGYSGHVMMIKGGYEAGMSMDMSDWQIPVALVESMTFRVYAPNNIKEVRLADASDFIVRHVPAAKGEWIDITVYADGTGFNGANFDRMINDDTTLGQFHFCLRYTDSVESVAYLDGFSFKLKADDKTAPQVQYKGETTIKSSAGKAFELQNLVAYDAQEERIILPVLTWSEGALDANGLLLEGNHTCEATFTDYYGNQTSLTLTVQVGDVDTQAPVIKFGLTTIHATAGTRVDLAKTIKVEDNYDVVTPQLTWSEGALDAQGRLLAGTHTLTITATDLTGLSSQHTVTFVVANEADAPATPTPVV